MYQKKVLVKIPKIFSGLISPSGCSRFENCIMLLRREEHRGNSKTIFNKKIKLYRGD